MITRHQFLTVLHDLLKPKVYLEVGVQYGLSLDLAVHSEQAIGIDPNPLVQEKGNQLIFQKTSNDYFADNDPTHPLIDLAFIDGSHLFEDALQDFNNIVRLCHRRSVIVFDDVLPYNQEIASRTMPPAGDWTGDAWKIIPILRHGIPLHYGVQSKMVNTFPTGLFVVWNLPRGTNTTGWPLVKLELDYEDIVAKWIESETVPDYIINRTRAAEAEDVLDSIRGDLCESQ